MKKQYKNRYVEDDVMAQKDIEKLKKVKEKVYETAYKDYMKVMKWLSHNHPKILNEYCNKFLGGKRITFLGGKNGN